jgi:hypothetical protein
LSLKSDSNGSVSETNVFAVGSSDLGLLDISPGGVVTCDASSADCANVNWVMDAGKTVMVGTATTDSGAAHAITILTKTEWLPGAPTNVKATAGKKQATVTFTAGAPNGSPTVYTVTAIPAQGSVVGTDTDAGTALTTHVITGLASGAAYTFTVTGTNAFGQGPASASSNKVTIK